MEYPEGYPEDLLQRIEKRGGGFATHYGYRVAKFGLKDRRSYWSTFQEKEAGIKPRRPNENKNKGLSEYSTSFFLTIEKMKEFLTVSCQEYPAAVIIYGMIKPELGPSLLKQKTGHIHWWLYDKTTPQIYFSEVKSDEE